jgi:hypothetical protein
MSNCIWIWFIMLLVVTFITQYYLYVNINTDKLNYIIFETGFDNCCSTWPILHLLLYLILGFVWPDCWVQLWLMGVIWEIFEEISGRLMINKLIPNDTNTSAVKMQYTKLDGRWSDIVMNSIGLLMGVIIKKFL